jgi:dihydroxyacetone kinase-like protein
MEGVLLVDVTTVRAWIDKATHDIEENKDHLTHLDSAIGDADHGVNLVRGFQAVGVALDEKQPGTPGELLTVVGNALVSKVGGASGPLYGTAFRRAGKALGTEPDVAPEALGAALLAALEGVQGLGAAAEGDKTMVDALAPAVRAYQHAWTRARASRTAAQAAAAAAEKGAEAPSRCRRSRAGPATSGPAASGTRTRAPPRRRCCCTRWRRPWAGPGHDHHVPRGPCSPGAALARVAAAGCGPGPAGPGTPATPDAVRSAFEATATRLDDLAESFRADGAVQYADILEAEAQIARDPAFAEEVVVLLDDPGTEATSAVMQVAERHAAVMAGLASEDLRERAADIRQVGRMVSDRLAGGCRHPARRPFVLLAHEVTAPDLLEYAEQVTVRCRCSAVPPRTRRSWRARSAYRSWWGWTRPRSTLLRG